MRTMDMEFQPVLHVSRAQFRGIIDAVRNIVLDWSLKLETAGILGVGMTFSREEKVRAAHTNVSYQIGNQTVIHTMTHSQVQQGTTASSQQLQVPPIDVRAVAEIVTAIRGILPTSGLAQDERAEVEADLATAEAQARSPRPRVAIIKEALRSVRSILEGAAGGAAGAALPVWIERITALVSSS